MKIKTKSIIIGRKKRKIKNDDMNHPCFIAVYKNKNNPHQQSKAPDQILDYEDIAEVVITNPKKLSYLTNGNDLVVDNLKEINIDINKKIITIDCKKENRFSLRKKK